MTTHNVTTGLGRLKQLRDDLVALDAMEKKPIRFDMGKWKDDRSLCGTSACAVGYCAMQSWAQKEGLSLGESSDPIHVFPRYDGFCGFDAAANFFDLVDEDGIMEEEIYYLFDDGAYEEECENGGYDKPTISDVVARIDEVIAKREAAR